MNIARQSVRPNKKSLFIFSVFVCIGILYAYLILSTAKLYKSDFCKFNNLEDKHRVSYIYRDEGLTKTNIKSKHDRDLVKMSSIYIDEVANPVLLVFISYKPVIWKIYKTKSTRIAGILVGGNKYSAVLGVEKNIPIIMATSDNPKGCVNINYSDSFDAIEDNIMKYTSRKIDRFVSEDVGDKIIIAENTEFAGDKIFIYSDERSIEDYDHLEKVRAGYDGIAFLLAKNIIRKADKVDIDNWVNAARTNEKKVSHVMKPGKTYVVKEKFSIPYGLQDDYSLSFIIADNSLMPDNVYALDDIFQFINIYNMKTGTCTGNGCTGKFEFSETIMH